MAASIDHFSSSACVTCHVSFLGLEDPATRLNIGAGPGGPTSMSLANDHPMSVPYSDGSGLDGSDTVQRASLRDRFTVINSIDLYSGLATSTINSANLVQNLQQNRWAFRGFISDTVRIKDLLKNGKVECSTCHDPHFKNLTWDEIEGMAFRDYCGNVEGCTDGNFLRRVGGNSASAVCRTCHNK